MFLVLVLGLARRSDREWGIGVFYIDRYIILIGWKTVLFAVRHVL